MSDPFIMNGDINGPESPKHAKNGSVKGRIRVALLDDTIVSFDVSVKNFVLLLTCISVILCSFVNSSIYFINHSIFSYLL